MHPILFEIGGFPVYTYGLLLAAAYLLGLQFALMRARSRGLDANRVMDLGIWIIVSALVGAKLLLLIVDFDKFTPESGDLMNLVRSGGVFYGGLIAAVCVALWYLWRHKMPVWTVTDVFAPGIALGHVDRTARLSLRGLLFRKAHERSLGDHVSQRVRRTKRRDAARHPAASHPALRGWCGAADSRLSAPDRTAGPSVSRPDVLELHVPVRRLAIHHRVLQGRCPWHGRFALDVTVRIYPHRAAQHRDADPARAPFGP